MSTPLLDRPPELNGRRPVTPPPPRRPSAPPTTARNRRPRSVLVLLAVALTGGLAGAGTVTLLDGGGDDAATSTWVLPQSASTSTSSGSGTLNAASLYASAAPGVVDIKVATTGSTQGAGPFGDPQGGSSSTASGTGFVLDARGRIVTAAHVVDDAESITVTFQDGTSRTATLLGKDDATDVAVLRVDPDGLTLHPLPLGRSGSVRVGTAVAAIGDPFGYDRSISTGIISGIDRTIEAPNGFTVAHALQTDAALNPGNSGGPLLAANGAVLGIVDQIATSGQSEQSSGVGFVVPADVIRGELDDLIAGRAVSHAYIGLATTDSADGTSGALVSTVASGGPAATAGLRAGDVITRVGTTRVTGAGDVVSAVSARRPGDRVAVTVRRGGDTVTATVTLGTQPSSAGS